MGDCRVPRASAQLGEGVDTGIHAACLELVAEDLEDGDEDTGRLLGRRQEVPRPHPHCGARNS